MADKKKFFGRCGICDMNFYSREAEDEHLRSKQHQNRVGDSAIMEKTRQANRMSLLLGF